MDEPVNYLAYKMGRWGCTIYLLIFATDGAHAVSKVKSKVKPGEDRWVT